MKLDLKLIGLIILTIFVIIIVIVGDILIELSYYISKLFNRIKQNRRRRFDGK
ncbi:MAG: hypothetical protein PWR10_1567 [Halanaerobiales bacterium]|nr:hypothetical protein [Halanaerobiales bacterium]